MQPLHSLSPLLLSTTPLDEEAAPPRSNPVPARDRVILVGLNPQATHEYEALRSRVPVQLVADQNAPSAPFRVTGPSGRALSFDLGDPGAVAAFASTLGLAEPGSRAVAQALLDAPPAIRDELAQLALAWAPAERGLPIAGRLIVSGHGHSGAVLGEDNGALSWGVLAGLARALPGAAAQVEDIHIAACNTASERMIGELRSAFPRLRSVWAYEAAAPGSASGATVHQARWEQATRGPTTDLSRRTAEPTRFGGHVAAWSLDRGYEATGPARALADVREALSERRTVFDESWSGRRPVEDATRGPLRDYYQRLNNLLRHPELPARELPALEQHRDDTLRLLFFSSHVAPRFATHHQASIRAGYAAAGLPAPDLAELSRQEALEHVQAFQARAATLRPKPAAVEQLERLLTRGLRDLAPQYIPDGWL